MNLKTARPVIEEFLRPRHRHYQIDQDPNPLHLAHLTTRAWQAIQNGLDRSEATAQMIFDEINATLEEVDRMDFPREEASKKRLLALETERKDLRNRLANSDSHTAESRLKLANDQISSLNNVVEGLNGRISSMLASHSWQITAPLRVLQRWILG
jgi:hypothetical protein